MSTFLSHTFSPWGFPLQATFEFDGGEPATQAHPGAPPRATLLTVVVNGVNITAMVECCADQVAELERAALCALEAGA